MKRELFKSAMLIAGMVSLVGCKAGNEAVEHDILVQNMQQDFNKMLRQKSVEKDWEHGVAASNATACAALINWKDLQEFASKLSHNGVSFETIDRQAAFLAERRDRALALGWGAATSSNNPSCGARLQNVILVREAIEAIDEAQIPAKELGFLRADLSKVLVRELKAKKR